MNKNFLIIGGVVTFLCAVAFGTGSDYTGPIKGFRADECFDELSLTDMQAGYEGARAAQAIQSNLSMLDIRLHNSPEDLRAEIKQMPELAGYHYLNLREVLANDALVRDKIMPILQGIMQMSFAELFLPESNVREKVRDIIFIWYGVDKIDPASRGPFIDARELYALEATMGQPFLQLGAYPNPAPYASNSLKEAFDMLLNHYYSVLLMQVAAVDLLQSRFLDFRRMEIASGAIRSDALLGDVDALMTQRFDRMFTLYPQGVQRLIQVAAQLPDTITRKKFWQNVVYMTGMLNKDYVRSSIYRGLLNDAIQQTDESLTLKKIEKANVRVRKLPSGEEIPQDRTGHVVSSLGVYNYSKGWRKTCYKTMAPDDPYLSEAISSALRE